jgi:Rps23 Pro-64 3,4-dihydroxylase Tpa1-like proline 4-hydroxylase
MNTNQLELSSVESFLQSIEDGSQFVAAPEANQSQQNTSETKPTEVKPSAVQEGQQQSAEEFLEGMEEGELNPDGTKKRLQQHQSSLKMQSHSQRH